MVLHWTARVYEQIRTLILTSILDLSLTGDEQALQLKQIVRGILYIAHASQGRCPITSQCAIPSCFPPPGIIAIMEFPSPKKEKEKKKRYEQRMIEES
jgi:hypothetical protein